MTTIRRQDEHCEGAHQKQCERVECHVHVQSSRNYFYENREKNIYFLFSGMKNFSNVSETIKNEFLIKFCVDIRLMRFRTDFLDEKT